jgi:hypothetical protein
MSKNLTIYLNDHLAGSVVALELMDRLIETYKGKPLEQFFKDLHSEIDADQRELQDLIEALGEKESRVRKAGLWIGRKILPRGCERSPATNPRTSAEQGFSTSAAMLLTRLDESIETQIATVGREGVMHRGFPVSSAKNRCRGGRFGRFHANPGAPSKSAAPRTSARRSLE